MYDVIFNGETAKSHSAYIKERPSFLPGSKKYNEYELRGKDGISYEEDGTVEDIEISMTLSFSSDPEQWHTVLRGIKRWINSDGSMELSFSDDQDIFYKVKRTRFESIERIAKEIGELEVVFTCEGYQYLRTGSWQTSTEIAQENPGVTCKPLYIITANGMVYININDGDQVAVNAAGTIYIDTDRMIAYRATKEIVNARIMGDYEDLWLLPGSNRINISGASVANVVPRWRF